MALFAVPQVERRAARDVEEERELLPPLHAGVRVRQRRLEVVRDVLVELLVLRLRDVGLGPGPQRRRLIDSLDVVCGAGNRELAGRRFLRHQDRDRDVVGVLPEDGPQPRAVEELVLALPQVERHLGPALLADRRLDGVVPLPRALPPHRLRGLEAGAPRLQHDALGDDERGVEPDAELTDELGVRRPVPGQLLDELPGPRLRNRADVVDHFLARHADPVVADGNRARAGIQPDVDRKVRIALEKRPVRERLEPQLVTSIRCVRDDLSKENFLVRIQGVDHQLEQLTSLGLKGMRGSFRHVRHPAALLRRVCPWSSISV